MILFACIVCFMLGWIAHKVADLELEKENAELEAQIEKMKSCRSCKHDNHCNHRVCDKNLPFWELRR